MAETRGRSPSQRELEQFRIEAEHRGAEVVYVDAANEFPMPTLADVLCNACQLLDSVKMDWEREGCWSAWDQAVRDGLSRELKAANEKGVKR